MAAEDGYYAMMASSGDRWQAGLTWPATHTGRARLGKLGPKGEYRWSVGKHMRKDPHAIFGPDPQGQFHNPVSVAGRVRNVVVSVDRA